ncbi:AAA family ATPase [Effusibacillus lacus]|uniref:Stage V sporulation protein K n=1 Tax=Effusibacillus lacus TaxID=1348429 RepID=A0A292YSP0_9BACL|nr:AAA family ATPase [Effusibacillus lacus]TCS76390.1 stage V sporulation protein K [Effusibacillus lacus]GAX91931.1 stage V sporulation protein K [Effusibacillus lacus]
MSQNTLTFTYKPSAQPGIAMRVTGQSAAAPQQELTVLPEQNYEQALKELDKLIGLEPIKSTIHELAHYTAVQQYRKKQGYKTPSMSMHMAFLGNPGTGKTTVARLLAKLFHRIGILKEEKFREVSRVNLVGNYVGHTAKDTMSVLQEAKGGVLFIDEAYSLIRDNPNDFGMEAVETLLKYMEDHRNDIIVIFAGYREPMIKFLASNPGLVSRIPYQLHFPDYTVEELLLIAGHIAREYDYHVSSGYQKALVNLCFREKQKANFSNARFVRNCIEKSIRKQNVRLAKTTVFRAEELNLLQAEDL